MSVSSKVPLSTTKHMFFPKGSIFFSSFPTFKFKSHVERHFKQSPSKLPLSHAGCQCTGTHGLWTCCSANRHDLWLCHRLFLCVYIWGGCLFTINPLMIQLHFLQVQASWMYLTPHVCSDFSEFSWFFWSGPKNVNRYLEMVHLAYTQLNRQAYE